MHIDPYLLGKIPDVIAMPVLGGLLIGLRDRHPKLDSRSWLFGLGFIFLSQTTWMLRGSTDTQATLRMVLELLAGLSFACYRGETVLYRSFDLPYLFCNSLVLIAVETLYGLKVRSLHAYLAAVAAGLVVLVATTIWRRQDVFRACWGSVALLMMLMPISFGLFDVAAYFLLAAVYGYAAHNFDQRLTPKSIGKVAMLTGVMTLAVFYAVHPWMIDHPHFNVLAEHIGSMQKFIIAVGMLLVLVENQSSRNHYLALHDQLTGIPNRRMLDSTLKSEIEWAQKTRSRLTLLMIDLNGFKQVNDTHGHLAGDHVLHEVAKRLRHHLRASELIARMGGDEFVILTRSAVSEDQVKLLEANVRKWLREPIDWDEKRLWIDGSMGAARFPDDVARWSDDVGRDTSERLAGALLRIADLRMYAQKPSSKAGLAELETLFPPSTMLQ